MPVPAAWLHWLVMRIGAGVFCFADATMDVVFWSSVDVPAVLTLEARDAAAPTAETLDLRQLPLPVTLLRRAEGSRHLLIQEGPRVLQIEVLAAGPTRGPLRILAPLWPPPEDEPRLLALHRFLHVRRAQTLPDRLYKPERRAGR